MRCIVKENLKLFLNETTKANGGDKNDRTNRGIKKTQ